MLTRGGALFDMLPLGGCCARERDPRYWCGCDTVVYKPVLMSVVDMNWIECPLVLIVYMESYDVISLFVK